MAYRLTWDSEAFDAIGDFRNHQPALATAFDHALDQLRSTGSIPGSMRVGESFFAHVSSVFVPGYPEHVLIWSRESDGRLKIIYVGPLDSGT